MYYMETVVNIQHHEMFSGKVRQVVNEVLLGQVGPRLRITTVPTGTVVSINFDVPDKAYPLLEKLSDALTQIPTVEPGVIRDVGDRPQTVFFGKQFIEIEQDLRNRRMQVLEAVRSAFPHLEEEVLAVLSNQ